MAPDKTGGTDRHLAVVGTGLSALAVTVTLLRRLRRPFGMTMIHPGDEPGILAGEAAGEALTAAPARALSLLPDRPDDFVDWLRDTLLADRSVLALNGPGSLHVPSALFRSYAMARLAEAIGARRDVAMRVLRGRVVRIDPLAKGGRVVFDDGGTADFDHVFVAAG